MEKKPLHLCNKTIPNDLQAWLISVVVRFIVVAFSITLGQLRHDPALTRRKYIHFLYLTVYARGLCANACRRSSFQDKYNTVHSKSSLFQYVVDGDLKRSGLKQEQRTESVEECLKRLWQVRLLVRYEARWQRVLG